MQHETFSHRSHLASALTLFLAAAACAQGPAPCEGGAAPAAPPVAAARAAPSLAGAPLGLATYGLWREAILPAAAETSWLEIPWLPTFAEGVVESARQGKPLLLWGMNGHPLGCT